MAIEDLECNGEGEILVQDIIQKINELVLCCNDAEVCCDELKVGDIIRTRLDGNVLYMTNDKTAP